MCVCLCVCYWYHFCLKRVRQPLPCHEHNYALNSVDESIQFPWELFGVAVISLLLLFDFFLSTVCDLSDRGLSLKETLPVKKGEKLSSS